MSAIRPNHYKRLTPEPKDVIRDWGLNFNLGSAVKYIARAGHKDDIVQELKKAQEFIQFEIDAIEAEREKNRGIKVTASPDELKEFAKKIRAEHIIVVEGVLE